MSRVIVFLTAFLLLTPALTMAHNVVWAHVRGSIARLDGHVLTVTAHDASTVRVWLIGEYGVFAVTKAKLASVTPGTYIGTTALRQPDGAFKALEVLIFPASARGIGEGHHVWDLTPGSSMTNATVAEVIGHSEGRLLTLKYKAGDR